MESCALSLPYAGTVDISVGIVRGNPVDVFLITPAQIDLMKKEEWANVKVDGDFSATKTTAYRRSGQLGQGTYYLILRDTSLGIFSSSSSDISLKAQLNP